MNEQEWNRGQEQERPLWKSTAYARDLAAVADRAIDVVLLEDLNLALWLLGRNLGAGNERRRGRLDVGINGRSGWAGTRLGSTLRSLSCSI
jgi:hypothetical protein